MSQVQTCVCIANGLFISSMAKLSFFVYSIQSVLFSLHIIHVFKMTVLLRRTFFLNEQETKYISVYLNEDLKTQVKTGTSSGHAVLNDLQWIILVIFKSNISKNEEHKLGDQRHTLSMYCGRYIRIRVRTLKCI